MQRCVVAAASFSGFFAVRITGPRNYAMLVSAMLNTRDAFLTVIRDTNSFVDGALRPKIV